MALTAREELLIRAAEVGAQVEHAKRVMARMAARRAELERLLGL